MCLSYTTRNFNTPLQMTALEVITLVPAIQFLHNVPILVHRPNLFHLFFSALKRM